MDTKDPYSRSLGAALSEALSERGITTLAAANATGIPRTTLIRRLTGATPLTVVELHDLCDLLDVSVPDFVASVPGLDHSFTEAAS